MRRPTMVTVCLLAMGAGVPCGSAVARGETTPTAYIEKIEGAGAVEVCTGPSALVALDAKGQLTVKALADNKALPARFWTLRSNLAQAGTDINPWTAPVLGAKLAENEEKIKASEEAVGKMAAGIEGLAQAPKQVLDALKASRDAIAEAKTYQKHMRVLLAYMEGRSFMTWQRVSGKMPLAEGQSIRTGAGTKVTLACLTRGYIWVYENSSLVIRKRKVSRASTKEVFTRLYRGIYDFYFPKNDAAAKKLEISTDRVVVGIKGTKFRVTHAVGVTAIQVFEGSVDVTDADGKHTVLGAGQSGTFGSSEGASAPAVASPPVKPTSPAPAATPAGWVRRGAGSISFALPATWRAVSDDADNTGWGCDGTERPEARAEVEIGKPGRKADFEQEDWVRRRPEVVGGLPVTRFWCDVEGKYYIFLVNKKPDARGRTMTLQLSCRVPVKAKYALLFEQVIASIRYDGCLAGPRMPATLRPAGPKPPAEASKGHGVVPAAPKALLREVRKSAARAAALIDAVRKVGERSGGLTKTPMGDKVLHSGTWTLGGITGTTKTTMRGKDLEKDVITAVIPSPAGGTMTMVVEDFLLIQPGPARAADLAQRILTLLKAHGFDVATRFTDRDTICEVTLTRKTPATSKPPAEGKILYTNRNPQVVKNGPTAPTVFTLKQPALVTLVMTYHWNQGRGIKGEGIALRHADGTVYGPWPVTTRKGQGNVPNAYWEARPNIVIKAGTYTIVDSNPATWAQNTGTGERGMAEVMGWYRAGPAATPTKATGGTTEIVRGRSFFLVDLTPYGGKKGRPENCTLDYIPVDGASWLRLKHHGKDGHSEPKMTLSVAVRPVRPVAAVAVLCNLDHAHAVGQGRTITRLTVQTSEGDEVFDIQAGVHASDWIGQSKHKKAPTSLAYGRRYLPVFKLKAPRTVTGLRFDYVELPKELDHMGNAPGFCLRGITLVLAGQGGGRSAPPLPPAPPVPPSR